MIDLVREIDDIRKRARLTQQGLADISGYERSNLGHWFTGRNTPLLSAFIDVANALGYDVVLVRRKDSEAA